MARLFIGMGHLCPATKGFQIDVCYVWLLNVWPDVWKESKWWSSITTAVVAFAGNGLPIGRWQRVPGTGYMSITVGYLVLQQIPVGYLVLEQMWGTTFSDKDKDDALVHREEGEWSHCIAGTRLAAGNSAAGLLHIIRHMMRDDKEDDNGDVKSDTLQTWMMCSVLDVTKWDSFHSSCSFEGCH